MSSHVLAGQPRSLPSSERPRASLGAGVQESWGWGHVSLFLFIFWFLVSVQNKFRLTRMSSLVLAGQPRSLPSSERPRASSGTGVQVGGGDMYHYFYSFFGFWFRCKINFD